MRSLRNFMKRGLAALNIMTENKKTKLKKAATLRYESGKDSSPRVTAKGTGLVADRIIELASKQGIPISEDPDLVEALIKLDFQEEIPQELYKAVAEILAFAYGLNRNMMKDE